MINTLTYNIPNPIDSKRAYAKVFQNIDIEGSPNFQTKIRKWLFQIARTMPGIDLCRRVFNTKKMLKICETDFGSIFEPQTNTIQMNPNKTLYISSRNGDNELIFMKNPKKVILVHELIHAMHYLENPQAYLQRNSIFHPTMDTDEEGFTINGISYLNYVPDLCCENSFHTAFQRTSRIDHSGEYLPSNLSLTDFVILKWIGNIKEKLKQDPSLINSPHNSCLLNCAMTPLSAACYCGNEEMIQFLLSQGADLKDGKDDFGGPLIAAIKGEHYSLAEALFYSGANTDFIDKESQTSISILLQDPNIELNPAKHSLLTKIIDEIIPISDLVTIIDEAML